MPTIQVLIFRGTGGVRNKNHPHYHESALIRAGHVGVAGIIKDKIIGFHPTPEITKELGGEIALLGKLENFEAQPGCLQDNNQYFNRADELAEKTAGRTTVYTYDVEISDDTLKVIQKWYNDKKEALYNFPDDGEFKGDETNCATFWLKWFEIPLPIETGSIKELTDYMKDEDYPIWHAKKP